MANCMQLVTARAMLSTAPERRPKRALALLNQALSGNARSRFCFWHVLCGEHSEADTDHPGELFDESPRISEIHDRSGRDRRCRAVRHFARQGAGRAETLLIVSESGPNNIDIHGVGTNVPGYEVSWNCYDRLISHEMKTGPNGTPYYDRDKFKPELAEDMNVGDMSATFKLKKNATFQDGTPVTAKDVKWSLDRAVSRRRLPDLPDERRLADQARAVRRRRRPHGPRRFPAQGPADDSRSRGDRALRSTIPNW